MVNFTAYIFWFGAMAVFYTYVGYGVIIYLISKIKTNRPPQGFKTDDALPSVTMMIAAFNEEAWIGEKIRNTLALDYPNGKLSVFVVTDGSSDRTAELAAGFSGVQVFHESARKGKIHAVNRVMPFVSTPIVVFSDANTYLNREALRNIVRHYRDEKTGGVAGEKKIAQKKEDNASGAGEGLYWKYESFLKRKDSDVYSAVGAAGELFSIRTALYEPPGLDMIIEDFYMSVRIVMKGYRFVYEPDACATESASPSVNEEWKRKVRISAGGFQAMSRLLPLLNIFRYGLFSFQYISHRVLRWTLAPLCLPFILITNVILALTGSPVYILFLIGHVLFYALAALGALLQERKIAIKGFFVPYYFSVMNVAVYFGFIRFLRGKQSVVWEKAARADTPAT